MQPKFFYAIQVFLFAASAQFIDTPSAFNPDDVYSVNSNNQQQQQQQTTTEVAATQAAQVVTKSGADVLTVTETFFETITSCSDYPHGCSVVTRTSCVAKPGTTVTTVPTVTEEVSPSTSSEPVVQENSSTESSIDQPVSSSSPQTKKTTETVYQPLPGASTSASSNGGNLGSSSTITGCPPASTQTIVHITKTETVIESSVVYLC